MRLWQCPAECNVINTFAWSPDGTHIAVSVTTPDGDRLGVWSPTRDAVAYPKSVGVVNATGTTDRRNVDHMQTAASG